MLTEEEIDQTIRDTETDAGHYHKGHYLKVIKQLKADRDLWRQNWERLALASTEAVK